MQINKSIDVPREFIFDKIIESCLYDIEKNTGKKPKLNNLKHFSYVKKFSATQEGRVKFDEVDGPAVYAFTTSTNKRTYHTRWELHRIDNQTTNVVISEQQESNGVAQLINDKLVNLLFGHMKKRQLLTMLERISKAYQSSKA